MYSITQKWLPSNCSAAYTSTTFGCLVILPSAWSSCTNRPAAAGCDSFSLRITLNATSRPMRVSWALYTRPMPPSPRMSMRTYRSATRSPAARPRATSLIWNGVSHPRRLISFAIACKSGFLCATQPHRSRNCAAVSSPQDCRFR